MLNSTNCRDPRKGAFKSREFKALQICTLSMLVLCLSATLCSGNPVGVKSSARPQATDLDGCVMNCYGVFISCYTNSTHEEVHSCVSDYNNCFPLCYIQHAWSNRTFSSVSGCFDYEASRNVSWYNRLLTFKHLSMLYFYDTHQWYSLYLTNISPPPPTSLFNL